MPSRVVRGEVNESESLSLVSMEADLTFRCLLVAVDDYGRLDARPAKLKAALYPMRESVTPEMVVKWVLELAAIDDPPVVAYCDEGRPYLCLPKWEIHRGKGRRASESRYPEPPESSSDPQEILGNPRKSSECPGDPPVGRGTRDVGRGTRDGGGAKTSASRSTPKVPLPEPLPVALRAGIEKIALGAGLDPEALIENGRDWATRGGKVYAGERGWLAAFRSAVREGWSWVPDKGLNGSSGNLSPAQQRAERTKQAARDAFTMKLGTRETQF